MRWGTLLLAVASITAGPVTAAQAADTSVGAPADASGVGTQGCLLTGCVLSPRHSIPDDGRIVSWRATGDASGVRLRVLRPNADGTLTAAGTSAPAAIDAAGTPHDTDLPVRRGDRIGLELPGGGAGPSLTPVLAPGTEVPTPLVAYAHVPGAAFDALPPLTDGASARPYDAVTSDAELLVSATVRTPDSPAPAPAAAPTPAPRRRHHARAKRGSRSTSRRSHRHRGHRHRRASHGRR
jgi:hypothetical protein